MNPEDPEKQQLVCPEAEAGPSSWEEFTPEVSAESRFTSYRFRCPRSGLFHCTLTELVFVVDQKAELQYGIIHWNEDLVESAGRIPAGPLFRFECPEDAICKLHLPHCETKQGQRPGELSVAQISDDGVSFLVPLEITDAHVVIDVLHLSTFGLVNPFQHWFSRKSVSGQVLLFLGPPNLITKQQKLNVLLLPSNIPVDEVQNKQWTAKQRIKAPSDCELIKSQSYSVDCPNACKVQPQKASFVLTFGPNYHPTFEIRLPMNSQRVTVTVKDQKDKEIWKQEVHLTDPAVSEHSRPSSQQNVSLEDQLFLVQPEFSVCVSEPVLNLLLDKLLQQRFINAAESEEAKTKGQTDRARYVIDLVRHKGPGACSCLIQNFCETDPHLSKTLNLSLP